MRRDLWAPDEARYAYVAREMVETNEFAIPHRHGEYYAHKPPLMFWMITAGSKIFGGFTPLATRLPSLIGALLSLWATSRLALRWGGPAASWRAPLILMTCALFWAKGGMGQIDSLLCGLEMAALALLFSLPIRGGKLGEDKALSSGVAWRLGAAGLLMGLAILAKGPVGFLVPLLAFVFASIAAGEARRLRTWHWLWALPLALVPPAIWLWTVTQSSPPEGYLDELLFKQNVGRAAGVYGHKNPFYFFLLTYPGELLPWSLFLPAAFLALRRAGGEAWRNARRLVAWIVTVIVFFSLSPSKRDLYILLAFPAGAILLALGWEHLARMPKRLEPRLAAGLVGILGIGCIGATVAGFVQPDLIPMNTLWLLPTGIIALAAAIWLWKTSRSSDESAAESDRWFRRLWISLFAIFATVGGLVFPALNPVKAPNVLTAVAEQHIDPEDPIFLYQIVGEIFALYAERPGRYFSGPQALTRAMDAQNRGVIVLREEHWDRLPESVQQRLHSKNPFVTGSKDMIWCPFGEIKK